MTAEGVVAPTQGAVIELPTTVDDGAVSFTDPSIYTNREASMLDFHERVLAQASDPGHPLLERVKFLAIAAANLDEFTSKRVGWLKRALATEPMLRTLDGRTIVEQEAMVNARIRAFIAAMYREWKQELQPLLAEHGITVMKFSQVDKPTRRSINEHFYDVIYPTLTPLVVDPGHPFPFISSHSLSLALVVGNPRTGEERFARIKAPANHPRFINAGEGRFVPLEQVIAAHASTLFPGRTVSSSHAMRVIRSAEVSPGEEAEDLMELVESELRRRRLAQAVRLEVAPSLPASYLDLLLEELEVSRDDVVEIKGLVGLADLMELASLEMPDLRDSPYTPAVPSAFARGAVGVDPPDFFAAIRERDVLVHHPYESFDLTVGEFVVRAAEDPNVLAIKQTLYRTSQDSPIVDALIEGSESGKQVAVLVELSARFDEANNIEWARKLEAAGVHVAYGMPGYKIHSKICLVVRQEGDRVMLYGHIGTGNYNSETARLYTDFGLFTARTEICQDLLQVFNYLTGYAESPECDQLVLAPFDMRRRLEELIRREIEAAKSGEEARIILKMNALEDFEFTRLLYEAAQAGVQVDLIVRGICRIQPGAAGSGDRIRVVSVVGKYLEHSRLFAFHNRGDPLYWIGSADLMKRNLDERIEALAPVRSPEHKQILQSVVDTLLADRRSGWRLQGTEWKQPPNSDKPSAHALLERSAPFS
jgi:polyphosphate kinase